MAPRYATCARRGRRWTTMSSVYWACSNIARHTCVGTTDSPARYRHILGKKNVSIPGVSAPDSKRSTTAASGARLPVSFTNRTMPTNSSFDSARRARSAIARTSLSATITLSPAESCRLPMDGASRQPTIVCGSVTGSRSGQSMRRNRTGRGSCSRSDVGRSAAGSHRFWRPLAPSAC